MADFARYATVSQLRRVLVDYTWAPQAEGPQAKPEERRRVSFGHRDALVASAHLHHLNPWPKNTGDVVRSYPKVLIPEMNTGQLLKLIRAEFLVEAEGFNKVQGQPIFAEELANDILRRLG